jgi:diguanylate cyclase (GGDEF)-like protein
MFLSIRWKIMLFLSGITFTLSAAMVYYDINLTHKQFEFKRLEQFRSNTRLFQKLLSDNSKLLSQIAEFSENRLDLQNLSKDTNKDKAEDIWKDFNEQFDLLYFQVRQTVDQVSFTGSGLDLNENNKIQYDLFNYTLVHYLQITSKKTENISFIYCFDECLFFTIIPIPHEKGLNYIVLGKSLADTFILFHQTVEENVGILQQLNQSTNNFAQSHNKQRILKNWDKYVLAVTEFEQTMPLLQKISQRFDELKIIENTLFLLDGFYLSVANLSTGLESKQLSINQSSMIDFIILKDETDAYNELNNSKIRVLLVGFMIWFISQFILFYVMNQSVSRLRNLSSSLKYLTLQNYDKARNAVVRTKASYLNDEFDDLEQSNIHLTDTLQLLNNENVIFKDNIEKQIEKLNLAKSFSERLINESNSYLLIQDRNLNILSVNSKLEHLLDPAIQLTSDDKNRLIDTCSEELFHFKLLCTDTTYPLDYAEKILELVTEKNMHFSHDANYFDKERDEVLHIAWSHVKVEDEREEALILSEGIDLTQRIKAEEKLSWLAYHDTLTGLSNRVAFQEKMEQVVDENHDVLILQININRFKAINDLYGQAEGDAVLCITAEHIKKMIRINDSVYRLAADEFAVILYRIDKEVIDTLAQKYANSLKIDYALNQFGEKQPLSVPQAKECGYIHYDCSIAIIAASDGNNVAELVSNLSNALTYAKEKEGKLWHVYNSDDDFLESVKRDNYVTQKIHQAMEEDAILLVYQPIWSIQEKQISHYEVLTRIVFADGERLFPNEFIQVAERQGIIHQLDGYIMDKALSVLAQQMAINPDIRFSINVSAPTLQPANYDKIVSQKLREKNIDAKHVTLEVTETSVIKNFNLAVNNLERLVEQGLTIALDDFGVGFTSINYLKEMPLAYVKLDGLYIKNLLKSHEDQVFVKSITAMAKAYGLKVIAEYVENRDILMLLEELQVSNAQGYYIGKPERQFLPADFKL